MIASSNAKETLNNAVARAGVEVSEFLCVRRFETFADVWSAERSAVRHHSLRVSAELEVGRAGEYWVMADLLPNGWVGYPTSQGVPYDIAVDIGQRVIRVQVKSTSMPKTPDSLSRDSPLYVFHTRRAGKGGRRRSVLQRQGQETLFVP